MNMERKITLYRSVNDARKSHHKISSLFARDAKGLLMYNSEKAF